VVDSINMRRDSSRGDVPIVVLERIQIGQRDGYVPIIAFGRISWRKSAY
jgi:hypothetical protein